jgi:hypothetical protein
MQSASSDQFATSALCRPLLFELAIRRSWSLSHLPRISLLASRAYDVVLEFVEASVHVRKAAVHLFEQLVDLAEALIHLLAQLSVVA